MTVAMQRLSKSSGCYPTALSLGSVKWTDNDYITSGTFGDIFKGEHEGKAVCVKVIRPLQLEDSDAKKLGAVRELYGKRCFSSF
jgi:hypothetical protein